MSELRDQHKAFAEWFLQQNPIAPNVEDMAWAAWKAALAQPPRDEWRDAVIERLIICCIYRSEHDLDPNLALRELIDWEVKIALDPDVSNRAQELINLGRRSVDPTLE